MDTSEDVQRLERLIVQLNGLREEMAIFAKKNPNETLNKFKLKLVNQVLAAANTFLTGSFKPFDDFDEFNDTDLPSNSDVTMVLAQYLEQFERFRSDNVMHLGLGRYVYRLKGVASEIDARPPTRVGINR